MTSRLSLLLVLLLSFLAFSQSYTVETVFEPGSALIDDGMVFDSKGNLYGSQWGFWPGAEGKIVTKLSPDGKLDTVATGLRRPNGLVVDKNDNLYIANSFANQIVRVTPEGEVGILAFTTKSPTGITISPDGTKLFYSSYGANAIYHIPIEGGSQVKYYNKSHLNGPTGILFDDEGYLHVASFDDGKIYKFFRSDSFKVLAQIPGGNGFISWNNGKILATSHGVHKIYYVHKDGTLEHFAGSGVKGYLDGNAMTAEFNGPNGIVATPSGDTIYVSEWDGKSLRRMIRSSTTSVSEDLGVQDFYLEQNFPNPFNPSTRITFSVPVKSKVNIDVFNSLGQKVTNLVNKNYDEGKYDVLFDATGFASGIYFYKLNVSAENGASFADTGKMVLMK